MFQHVHRSVLSVVIATGAVVSLGLSAAQADPGRPGREDRDDARRVAQEQRATRGQNAFNDLVARTVAAHPADVVDFAWDGARGTVVVADGADALAAQLAASGTTVETAAPGAVPYVGRSDVELAAIEQLQAAGVENTAARYDAETNSVQVTAWTDEVAATAERVDGALDRSAARSAAGPAVVVAYEPAADVPQENTTQGGEVYGGCTGGFMAKRGTAYGITTSAHCTTKPSTYDGDRTGSTYVASNNRDVRFTALSGDTPENKFRIDSSTLRTINATGIVSSGSLLFKYGKTTGYGSSTVESYAGCVTFSSGNVWCNLYYTKDKVTSGGDSGGPWFVAYTGYGFTTGSNSGGSYVTPIAWVGSISGSVTVKTS
ncbi:hypothetical protein [Cellulomonas septica]|uniref:Serine protease n=1 Tax=Cellulomonas septica TaxID=285080 RepID=A0ABX1K214_9CELL|nr:hypothetical protein [Cellulomonas septica]NKY39997.1 hypothetical protein [Cellulomonas septica]